MSLAKRLASEAGRSSYAKARTNAGGRKSKQSNAKELDLQVAELNKLLNKIPGMAREAAFGAGLRPAASVVRKRVKELTPRSSTTGSTKKWSEKTKAKRQGELPLWKTVKLKLWRGSKGSGLGMVGYDWPKGNKGHFVVQSKNDTRRQVLWGNITEVDLRKKADVLKRAFDETKEEAARAFAAGVSKDVTKRLEGLRRG